MSGASLRKLYGDWLAQVQNDNNSPINAEQLMPILQMQGIIRQNDIYTVTRKTSAVEQNKELFLAVLPTYGDFALKKLIKLLQSNGNAHVDKLIQLDSGRRASIASGEPIQIEEPVVEKEAPKVEAKIYANFVNKSLGCKGLALIINNENYLVPWLKNRTGSETDVRNLTTVLTGLGYKVDVHRNLTADICTYPVDVVESEPDRMESSSASDDLLHAVREKIAERRSSSVPAPISNEFELELQQYFCKAKSAEADSDPFEFWNQNKDCLPKLFNVAVDILSIPATSAPVERVFSRASIVLSKNRHNLSNEKMEKEVFFKFNAEFLKP